MDKTEIHHLTADQKLKHWGYGEWVEEPDEVIFEYEGWKCRIRRPGGGYLCGYICIPENNKYYLKDFDEIDIEVHGGITYSEKKEEGNWIGFDCAHINDYTPHTKRMYQTIPEMTKIREDSEKRMEKLGITSTIPKPTYKNIAFCIQQCQSMVDQLKALV